MRRADGVVELLALDLGTQTGWALGSLDHRITVGPLSGTESFALGRFDGGGMRGLRFQRWLEEMLPGTRQMRVAYEEVRRHMGVDAAHAYGGFQAMLTAHCEERLIPYEGVPVGTIKKSLTGKGNANKALMLAKARELGYAPADDNEADAIALWLLVKAQSEKATSRSSSGPSRKFSLVR